MRLEFNRLADQYLTLGCVAFFSAVVGLLIFRSDSHLYLGHVRGASLLLLLQLIAGVVVCIQGVTRKLKPVVIQAQAGALCPETSSETSAGPCGYQSADLIKMLKTGAGIIYPSKGLSDRMLYQLLPELMTCSPVLQNEARAHFAGALAAAITSGLFLLMLFSAFLGLYANQENATVKWAALFYFCFLSTHAVIQQKVLSPVRIGTFVALAIFIPPLIAITGVARLGVVSDWIFVCFVIVALLPVLQFWAFFSFLKVRMRAVRMQSATTTHDMRLQGTLIPDAICQYFSAAFQKQSGAVYRCYKNELETQKNTGISTSGGFGSISGEMLLESDPALLTGAALKSTRWAWAGVAIAVAGLVAVYTSIDPDISSTSLFIASLVMIFYGMRIIRTVEFFSTECLFQSTLTLFALTGTYNTARSATTTGSQSLLHMQEEGPNIDATAKITCANLLSKCIRQAG